MKQEELDALPEDGTVQMVEVNVGGVRGLMPKFITVGALWARDGEPETVRDSDGCYWRVGWADGVKYKRRIGRP